MGELRQDQQALREQLNKLLEELHKKRLPAAGPARPAGQQPGQQGGEGDQLGRAGEAMGEARRPARRRRCRRRGRIRRAARSRRCARARRAWRSRCSSRWAQGPGPGNPGRTGQARANQDTDPLGRPLRGRDYGDDTTVKVPGEIDVQRARRILEELRKRFGESFRPQLELDYIERLLKDY